MKATKNQAAAVRSYLSTLGMNITHVQALEVIARGAGHRSRHIKAPTVGAPGAAVQAEVRKVNVFDQALKLQMQYCAPERALNLETATHQLMEMFPELFNTPEVAADFLEQGDDESINMYCSEMSLANAIREVYWAGDRSQVALARALRELVSGCGALIRDYHSAYWFLGYSPSGLPDGDSVKLEPKMGAVMKAHQLIAVHCKQCDTELDDEGYCGDSTCPFHDWPQKIPADDLAYYSTAVLEHKYGPKRKSEEDVADDIRWEYYMSGCQRSDLEEALAKLLSRCGSLFDGEEAAMQFLMDGDETAVAVAIKAEYNASRCHADDVDHAVTRLLAECPSLYQDSRKAWGYINEETHEELEGQNYLVQVESDVFGPEVFTYYTEEERRAGIVRLMAKAVELNDGVDRSYYFSEIDSDIEKDTAEYDQELRMRELEGSIVGGLVTFRGDEIGTIADLTADGLTLYSWIDENP